MDEQKLRPSKPERRFHRAVMLQVGLGAALGFAIWIPFAPREAWDFSVLGYWAFLFLAGVATSFGRLRQCHWGPIGLYFGQLVAAYTLIPAGPGIMPVPFALLLFGTIPAFLGALTTAVVFHSVVADHR